MGYNRPMENIGIIGFGNMGEAFAAGLKGISPDMRLGVFEKVPSRVAAAKERFGAEDYTASLEKLLAFADVVILAVKPQDVLGVLKELSPLSGNRKFLSIVAGKTIDFYRKHLDTPYIARLMPNLAAMYQKAAVGVSFPDSSDTGGLASFRREVLALAGALGEPLEIPERLMPMMTGLSGSGIAFVFSFVHALAMGGVKTGLGYDKALGVALKVVEGAVEVMRKTGENPGALIAKVASPAGTTIAGLQALEEAAFTASVMRAVEEASLRAEELEG